VPKKCISTCGPSRTDASSAGEYVRLSFACTSHGAKARGWPASWCGCRSSRRACACTRRSPPTIPVRIAVSWRLVGVSEVQLASRYQRRRFEKSAREQVINDLRQDAALTQQEIELVRQARADQLVQVAAANSNEVRHRVRE